MPYLQGRVWSNEDSRGHSAGGANLAAGVPGDAAQGQALLGYIGVNNMRDIQPHDRSDF